MCHRRRGRGRVIDCLLLLSFVSASASGASPRKLQSFLNPGCDDELCEKNITTVYLRAEGARDTLHYLWDFVGNPSVLLAITSPSAKLNINWEDYLANLPGSVNLTEEPEYTFGVVVQKIFEFNDVNDTGLLSSNIRRTNINVLNTKLFDWIRTSFRNDTEFVELQMGSSGYTDAEGNVTRRGNIRITLNGFGSPDHSDLTPHMLHSENSTQVDIILNNLETNSSFTSSRFGMELILVGESRPDGPMSIETRKSLDDEHTPGVFEVIQLLTPPGNTEKNGKENATAYLQWRPVSYTGSARDVTDTTESVYYPLVRISDGSCVASSSLLYAYYGDRIENILVEKLNITLGAKGDGFYKKSNYATWTFIIGYGLPPAEQFSYLVIMIISIGLGLPVLVIVAAGVYMCVRRTPKGHGGVLVNS